MKFKGLNFLTFARAVIVDDDMYNKMKLIIIVHCLTQSSVQSNFHKKLRNLLVYTVSVAGKVMCLTQIAFLILS